MCFLEYEPAVNVFSWTWTGSDFVFIENVKSLFLYGAIMKMYYDRKNFEYLKSEKLNMRQYKGIKGNGMIVVAIVLNWKAVQLVIIMI